MKGPLGIAVDSAGNLYIADQPNERIQKAAAGAAAPTPTPSASSVPVSGISTGGLIGLAALMVGAAFVILQRRSARPKSTPA